MRSRMEQLTLGLYMSGLFEKDQGSEVRSLIMSVYHVLLGQFGAMRINRTLSSYLVQQSRKDFYWREGITYKEGSLRNDQSIYCKG